MSQTKLQTHVEVVTDLCIGLVISVTIQWMLTRFYFGQTSHAFFTAAWITIGYTVVSYIRRYITRRFFNWLHTTIHGKLLAARVMSKLEPVLNSLLSGWRFIVKHLKH